MKKIEKKIKFEFDDSVDDGYIYLTDIKPGESIYSEQFILETNGCHLIIDFDKDKRILGFELLGGGSALPKEIVNELSSSK